MFVMITRYYRWKNLYKDIKEYVLSCDRCSLAKVGSFKNKAELKPFERPEHLFETFHFDIFEINSKSVDDNYIILTIVDAFSNYIFIRPMRNGKADTVAKELLFVICETGLPLRFVSDNAPAFVGKVLTSLFNLLGITHIRITPFSSRSNSIVERTHKQIANLFRCLLHDDDLRSRWCTFCPIIEWAMRSTTSEAQPISAYEILYGFRPRNWLDIVFENDPSLSSNCESKSEYLDQLHKAMQLIRDAQKLILQKNRETEKARYDRTIARPREYHVGDKVYLLNTSIVKTSGKFKTEYYPDVYVIENFSDTNTHNVQLRNTVTDFLLKHYVHVDKLKIVVPRLTSGDVALRVDKVNVKDDVTLSDDDIKTVDRSDMVPVIKDDTTDDVVVTSQSNDVSSKSESKDDTFYPALAIVKQRKLGGKIQFLIKWESKSNEDIPDSWCNYEDVTQELIEQFYKTHNRRGKRRKR